MEIDDDILLPEENLVFSRLRDNRQDSNESIIPDLMEVWDHHSDSECLMACIGQRKLLGTSFGMLRPDEDVPDEIIHAYLDILKRHNSGIETIDCFEMGRIINAPDEAKHLLLKESVDTYDMILCPYNSVGHWELIAALPKTKQLIYMDSFGEKDH